jgi:hypothetical protein
MSLEKVVSVDLIEVVENGCIQVRAKTAIKEDGDDYSAEDAKVQAICKALHTKDVVAAYKAAQVKESAA